MLRMIFRYLRDNSPPSLRETVIGTVDFFRQRDDLLMRNQLQLSFAQRSMFSLMGTSLGPRKLKGMDFSGTIIKAGFPGSGNGIAGAMLEGIVPIQLAPRNELMGFLKQAAVQRTNEILELLPELARSYQFSRVEMGTFRNSTATLACLLNGDDGEPTRASYIFGVPILNGFHEYIHKTHEPFDDYLQFFVSQNAKLVLSIRHPLDTLVSLARKMSLLGIDILNRPNVCTFLIDQMHKYYNSFRLVPKEQILWVRYEDIISSFYETQQKISHFITKNSDYVYGIKHVDSSILNKEFFKGHRWQLGTNKWKKYVAANLLGELSKVGLYELIDQLGYQRPDISAIQTEPQRKINDQMPGEKDTAMVLFVASAIDIERAIAIGAECSHEDYRISHLGKGVWFFAREGGLYDRTNALLADSRVKDLLEL